MYLYVKLNWDAIFFFPVESKDCMNSASYEYRNMSARRANPPPQKNQLASLVAAYKLNIFPVPLAHI